MGVGYCLSRRVWLWVPGKIVPAAVILPPDPRVFRDARERERLGSAIRALLRRMDSLEADSSGRRMYDSLVRARPGLLDSARVAERFISIQ